MLTLCGFAASNYYNKVKFALLEKGVPFTEELAWLGQTDPDKAAAAARKTYDGDGQNSEGERRESPALARQFADYNALIADETFSGWAETLYRPLLDAPWRSALGEEAGA